MSVRRYRSSDNTSPLISIHFLRYEEPISVDLYVDELFEGDANKTSKSVVTRIMAKTKTQLEERRLTLQTGMSLTAHSESAFFPGTRYMLGYRMGR